MRVAVQQSLLLAALVAVVPASRAGAQANRAPAGIAPAVRMAPPRHAPKAIPLDTAWLPLGDDAVTDDWPSSPAGWVWADDADAAPAPALAPDVAAVPPTAEPVLEPAADPMVPVGMPYATSAPATTSSAMAPDLWVAAASVTDGVNGARGYVTVQIENRGGGIAPGAYVVVAVRRPGISLASAASGPTSRADVPVVFGGGRTTVRVPLPMELPAGAPFCLLTTIHMPGDPGYRVGGALADAAP